MVGGAFEEDAQMQTMATMQMAIQMRNIITAITEPTAMPAITPLDRPPLLDGWEVVGVCSKRSEDVVGNSH